MSVTTPKMARPALPTPTPRGPRDELNATTLLRSSSLQPIIASRGGGRSTDPDESARLSHMRAYGARSDLSTPRNMFEDEDRSIVSQTLDVSLNSELRGGPHRSVEPILEPGAVVPYGSQRPRPNDRTRKVGFPPDLQEPRNGYYYGRRGHRRPDRRRNESWLKAPTCFIFLKIVELAGCLTILVLSRLWSKDLKPDYVYTVFGTCGVLTAAVGLLVIWVRGHPVPDDCPHGTMLLVYAVMAPMLVCGGILVLMLSDSNQSATIIASLFFICALLFSMDLLVMVTSILQCFCCCCCCYFESPSHYGHQRIYPNPRTYPDMYPDDYYRRQYPRTVYPHRYPYPDDPRRYGNGYASYPTSLPQMSVQR
ncbi:uncharacterized protein LOC143300538 [Babylonia areolata]|uniref:uncharacterized protein LOC143300538 n=1 Tax=Babylonia areolata TaxID=304850 RepID=UPI003FD4034E